MTGFRLFLFVTFLAAIAGCGGGGSGGNAATTTPQTTLSDLTVVESVEVAPETFELFLIERRAQVTATALNSDGLAINMPLSAFQWESSNDQVATVTDGIVTTHAFGTATISATVDGQTGTNTLTVVFPNSAQLLPEDWKLPTGGSVRFHHNLSDSPDEVEWSVNGTPGGNNTFGTISPNGIYSAPTSVPNLNTVSVRASRLSDPSIFAESPVTINNAVGANDVLESTELTPRVLMPSHTDPLVLNAYFSGNPHLELHTLVFPIISPAMEDEFEAVAIETGVYSWNIPSSIPMADPSTSMEKLKFLGSIVCDTCVQFENNPFIPILIGDSSIPSVAVMPLGSDIQASSHIVNMVVNGPVDYNLASLRPISQRLYAHLGDIFDFIVVRGPVDYWDTSIAGFAGQAKNDVSGIGRTAIDQTASYGSQGRLQSVIGIREDSGLDASGSLVLHEVGHRWLAYLDQPPINANAHWPALTNLSMLMGGSPLFAFSHVSQNVYEIGCISSDDPNLVYNQFSTLELYLMGLVPSSEVGPHVVFQDQSGPMTCGRQGTVDTVTIGDVIAKYGARTPGFDQSQKDFSMATIVLSIDRLLSAEEMAFFNHLAQRGEGTEATPGIGRIAIDRVNPFFLATDGRGTLSTRVLP